MIDAEFCKMMARYNGWQNRSLIEAASTLEDTARDQDRGAFFGSIKGTFSHLLWADQFWMSRFDGGDWPGGSVAESAALYPDWDDLRRMRATVDARIQLWADGLDGAALEGELFWFSRLLGRQVQRSYALCVVHFFNHQTHHRGQIHAMLTAAGAHPGVTDLHLMPVEPLLM